MTSTETKVATLALTKNEKNRKGTVRCYNCGNTRRIACNFSSDRRKEDNKKALYTPRDREKRVAVIRNISNLAVKVSTKTRSKRDCHQNQQMNVDSGASEHVVVGSSCFETLEDVDRVIVE